MYTQEAGFCFSAGDALRPLVLPFKSKMVCMTHPVLGAAIADSACAAAPTGEEEREGGARGGE